MSTLDIRSMVLPHADDFAVLIGWNGEEQKPYYRALLLGTARADQVVTRPFWGAVVIDAAELGRVIDVLAGKDWTAGPYAGQGEEYYVQIETAQAVVHCGLGFDRQTLSVLEQIAAALAPEHQPPVRNIVTRIQANVAEAGS